ncbi:MAG: hypothetical protein ACM3UO_00590 [Bacillota bacterium]
MNETQEQGGAVAEAPATPVDVPAPRSAEPAAQSPTVTALAEEVPDAVDHPIRVRLLAGLLGCAALLAALVILGAMAHYAGLFSGQVLAAGAALPVVVVFTLLLAMFFLGQAKSHESHDDEHHDIR